MSSINGDWLEALKGEFGKPYYKELFDTVRNEYKTRQIFPPADDIFNAFHLTPLKEVKVVILGQDPYHNVGQAHGLCFSVKPEVEVPPSLVNIYKELHDDLGCAIPDHGYLVKWAKQGVLMLNTVLTVRAHQANSHRGIGWEEFTDAAIRVLNGQDRPIVFILWGRPAQMKKAMLNNPNHLILEAPHPSPLSAYRGFFGSRPFSQTNAFLEAHGAEPVDWQIESELEGGNVMGKKYDLLIIGAGPGGYVAAQEAAKRGMSVVIIDKTEVGGTCVNRGCIPTKALIHASTLYKSMQECEKFGLYAEQIGFDLHKLYQYKDDSVVEMRNIIEEEFRTLGITFVKGEAAIQADKKVRVKKDNEAEELLEADNILIATGAAPKRLSVPGAELPEVMTSEELLTVGGRQYDRLVIVGGGIIGLEIATIFHALGTEVTVVELGERLLPTMDVEFADALEKILRQRGIHIYKESLLEKIEKEADGVSCHFVAGDEPRKIRTDAVLVSIGREAYTEGLFDRDLKIKLNRGKVVVNDFFMTNIPGIYAIGDVIGGVQLAHVASAQAKYVVERMNNAEPSVILSIVPSCLFVSMSIIPNCLYMNPEIASVGLTEEEAERKGVPVRCGKYVMNSNGQTIISKEETGFIKVLFAADSDVLLGAQIMCQRATDMIGELATAIANGLTSRQLMYAMRAHPTFNEAVSKAVESSRSGQRES